MSSSSFMVASRTLALMLGLASALVGPSAFAADADLNKTVANSVVKIFSTRLSPDVGKPWNKQAPTNATGSGVVIEGNRILTNAHVAMYASQVEVQGNESGDKLPAKVEFIAPGIDLAILKLEDESFFKTHAPLPRASGLPAIKDTVLTYGYPTGGESQSITKGIISRIEFVGFGYQTSGLRIQVDAALNPGNSGGPVVAGDQMIGLAFSIVSNAQSIGYIIPNEEVELFLKDVADGRYDGKPALNENLQTLENPALRAFLKLDKDFKGMVVAQPKRTQASYPLKKWDVITHIGDTSVDSQGMVTVDGGLRLSMRYMAQRVAKNDLLPVTLVRSGKTLSVQVPLITTVPYLVPLLVNTYPSYFIYGPMVLTKVTANALPGVQSATPASAGSQNALVSWSLQGSPLVTKRGLEATKELEELVMVGAPFFPHKITSGYSPMMYRVIKTINGVPVRSLAHAVTLLRDMKDEFATFDVDALEAETPVFRHKDMLAATDEVLTNNSIRSQGSEDMMKIWRGQ